MCIRDRPGLGRLVFQAIANRDLLVVRNVVMLLAAIMLTAVSYTHLRAHET